MKASFIPFFISTIFDIRLILKELSEIMNNNFDFTIAVSPKSFISLDREMKYIKTALLYADSIKLISSVAHIFFELTDETHKKDEKQALELIDKVIPFIKIADVNVYNQYINEVRPELKGIIYNKKYKNAPMVYKLQIRNVLNKFAKDIDKKIHDMLGQDICDDISFLVKSNKVKLDTFESSFDDTDEYVMEYFKKLEKSISNSYPLFDEQSNNLMGSAISEGIINISDVDKFKAGHAGLTDRLILKLPSFEFAEVGEILDIRKELEKPLLKFRGKTIEYAENIQTLPWDKDFEDECYILYNKEIVPSILEIEEMIDDNNILKNLGIKVMEDRSMLGDMSGLVISVAAAGAITTFSNVIASDKAMLATGGAWAISKIASAYNDYKIKAKEIERKDLYFYHKAGKNLIDKKYKM